MLIRLNKAIAELGICSRRKADELISAGKIQINGEVITILGTKVDLSKDKVEVVEQRQGHMQERDNTRLPLIAKRNNSKVYILLNKPVDYICSASNEQGASVLDLITPENNIDKRREEASDLPRVYPVGRLDKNSEGMVLLTNDGDFTNEMTHPRYEHEKEYEVSIDTPLTKEAQKLLQKGMHFGDIYMNGIQIVKMFNKGRETLVTVILREGKNRQIRKMFSRLGYPILKLRRTRIEKIELKTLPIGKWKFISKKDII
jgi:23S rRNA pseudouridine2605 synthase